MQQDEIWKECALPTCWRLFRPGEGYGEYCTRVCSRAADRLAQNEERLAKAIESARRADATDIYDRAAMLRLLKEGEDE